MIEYTVMDYEGEAVTIEDGEMLTVYADRGEHWNSETCEFEPDEDDDLNEPCGNDREDYGMGWYDCNTDWRSWR